MKQRNSQRDKFYIKIILKFKKIRKDKENIKKTEGSQMNENNNQRTYLNNNIS